MGSFNASRLGHLVFLKDHTTGALFLADTGASVSLVTGPASPHGCLLTPANGVAITIGPERSLILRLKDNRSVLYQCMGSAFSAPGHYLTTAYHPKAKGMVEITHCQLENTLSARTVGAYWPSHIP